MTDHNVSWCTWGVTLCSSQFWKPSFPFLSFHLCHNTRQRSTILPATVISDAPTGITDCNGNVYIDTAAREMSVRLARQADKDGRKESEI